MCTTRTRPQRKSPLKATDHDRSTLALIGGLVFTLMETFDGGDLDALDRFRPAGLAVLADCHTRGAMLRKLARLADEQDAAWHRANGREVIETADGRFVPLAELFPHLAARG